MLRDSFWPNASPASNRASRPPSPAPTSTYSTNSDDQGIITAFNSRFGLFQAQIPCITRGHFNYRVESRRESSHDFWRKVWLNEHEAYIDLAHFLLLLAIDSFPLISSCMRILLMPFKGDYVIGSELFLLSPTSELACHYPVAPGLHPEVDRLSFPRIHERASESFSSPTVDALRVETRDCIPPHLTFIPNRPHSNSMTC